MKIDCQVLRWRTRVEERDKEIWLSLYLLEQDEGLPGFFSPQSGVYIVNEVTLSRGHQRIQLWPQNPSVFPLEK